MASGAVSAEVSRVAEGHFTRLTNSTGMPLERRSATRSASQVVSRTQPCYSDWKLLPGSACRGPCSLVNGLRE